MSNTFSLVLTLATLITGSIWVFDRLKFILIRKKIRQHKKMIEGDIKQTGLPESSNKSSWVDAVSSIFPILAIVLVIRSFIYEPFQIPSCSMMPTLLVGDFILVEKFAYSLKDPLIQTTLLEVGKPKRGDIVVFKYPKDPNIDFVKRVIGLPGDRILYDPARKELQIYQNDFVSNSTKILPIAYSSLKESEWSLFFNINSSVGTQNGTYQIPLNELVPSNALRQVERIEKLNNSNHKILLIPQVYTKSQYQQYGLQSNEWIVPSKHYFMMGDNRDNSADSRMWGFVPEENLVGRVSIIWFSLNKHEGKWPTGVRLSRIGKVS